MQLLIIIIIIIVDGKYAVQMIIKTVVCLLFIKFYLSLEIDHNLSASS
jgi:hypothetical protein